MAGATGPTGGSSKSGGTIIAVVIGIIVLGVLSCGGIIAALVIPAAGQAREAARRVQCQNNLKQIVLALHNYHDTWQAFPPAYTVDANGRKLHSWRTLILPYLGAGGPSVEMINFNEPWDSPTNQAAGAQMPFVYRCPNDVANGPGSVFTNYVAVSGPNTVLENDKPVKIASITDGTSNTVVVVEAPGTGIHWMEPRDMDVAAFAAQFGGKVGGQSGHNGGGNVGFADGSVRFLPETLVPAVRQLISTRNDGQAVNLP